MNRTLVPLVRCVLALPLAALLLAAEPARAEVVRTPNLATELVSERTALVPGQSPTVALRLKIRDRWHTYWQNPGDSGLPTTLDWKLPAGITAGPIQWRAPKALPAGPLVNYGYEGEVFHLVDIAVPAALPTGSPVTLAARADWLVCEDTCIPEGADLSLTLPVAASAELHPKWGAPIRATGDTLPRPLEGSAPQKLLLTPKPGIFTSPTGTGTRGSTNTHRTGSISSRGEGRGRTRGSSICRTAFARMRRGSSMWPTGKTTGSRSLTPRGDT